MRAAIPFAAVKSAPERKNQLTPEEKIILLKKLCYLFARRKTKS